MCQNIRHPHHSLHRHPLSSAAAPVHSSPRMTLDEVTGKVVSRLALASVERARATEYAAQKADGILALHDVMHPRIAEDEKLPFIYDRIELPLIPVLWRMERNGVLLDRAR